jgi:outer membrane protein assembly factor BamB
MTRTILIGSFVLAMLSAALIAAPVSVEVRMLEVVGEGAKYWPRWRGPSGQGQVPAGQYTEKWSPATSAWKTTVPGRGNSSPIVWGDRIFLTTGYGNGEKLSVLAFSRADGKQLWETFIPQNGVEYVHAKNGFASATPATDGELVYVSFGRHGLFAFDFNGKMIWQHKFGIIDNYHGPAGSPVLYKDRIFIYQDANPASPPGQSAFVGAFDKKTGKPIWTTPRSETVGWGTAIAINTGERDELIVSSQRRVVAYDPASGKELWVARGMSFEVIPTPVVGHGLVFASSGRAGPTLAIRPGGSGDVTSSHVAWSSPRGSPFVPSAIIAGDLLYTINDMQSILTVVEAATGKPVYQERLGVAIREGFSASPVHVNGKLYFTNDDGQTFVVEAGRSFKLSHINELGEQTLASPALVDGTWYWRTASTLRAIR